MVSMMLRRTLCLLGAACVAFAAARPAQAQRAFVTVHGIAWDSLHSAPLEGAFITINGTDRAATSDARGYFRFDSLAPGTYVFAMDHPALDSIGFAGTSRRVVVTDGRDTVRTTVPSFAAFWHLACGNHKVPADSGIAYGMVRIAAGGQPARGAQLTASWNDVGFEKGKGVTQKRWQFSAGADTSGTYALCGVPANTALHIVATHGTGAAALTGSADIAPSASRVTRRDLAVAPQAARGVVAGVVTDAGGNPHKDARVRSDGVAEVRTDGEGKFVLKDVPAGTRQIDVIAIGMMEQTETVDVGVADTARVVIALRKMSALGAVRVEASAVRQQLVQDIDDRKKLGIGHYMDSTVVAKYATLTTALSDIPGAKQGCGAICLTTPVTSIRSGNTGLCTPVVWIDNEFSSAADLKYLLPTDIGTIELYRTGPETPMRYQPVNRASKGDPCGTLVVWTKRFLP